MPLKRILRRVGWALITACGLVLGGIAPTQAQGLTVATITVEGKLAQSVAGVQVRLSGAASGRAQILKTGEVILPGTELTLPRGARIELTSSNVNTITLHPGARFLVGVVTAKGESNQPLGGRVDFEIRKPLDFFNIKYHRITASVKGTEFSVEIDPAKSLKLTVIEGIVEVEREVQIRLVEAAGSDSAESDDGTTSAQGSGIRIAEDLKAGQSKTYQLDVDEYLAEFKNFGEAEAYFRKALTEAEASGNSRRILRAVQNLMEVYWKIGKPRTTLDLEGRCIDLARRQSDPAGEAACLRRAGIAYGSLVEHRKAFEYFEKSLAMQERVFAGRDHPGLATSFGNLGRAYGFLREHRKAIEYHEKSLAMRERVFAGRDHPDIGASLNSLGRAYNLLGEHRKAFEYHEKALAMRERVYAGRDHPGLATSFGNLGRAYGFLREHRKAIEYHEKSLAMRERVFAGRDHPHIAASFDGLGNAYYSLGEPRKAIENYEKSLAMREGLYAARDHPAIARSLRNLADAHEGSGEKAEADRYRKRAAAMQRRLKAK